MCPWAMLNQHATLVQVQAIGRRACEPITFNLNKHEIIHLYPLLGRNSIPTSSQKIFCLLQIHNKRLITYRAYQQNQEPKLADMLMHIYLSMETRSLKSQANITQKELHDGWILPSNTFTFQYKPVTKTQHTFNMSMMIL